MAIDTRYIIAPNLEQYFVDKDTGFPLSGGKVYFWEDNNRSTPKNVYQITGSPPNYTFSALPNPVSISTAGTLEDGSGNNVIPYYFPLDGNDDLQLYFVEVKSSTDVPQFTREAWPPGAVSDTSNTQVNSTVNLIPNGQFLSHVNIPADVVTGSVAGVISDPITVIGQGGWTFERPNTSTAVDNISFFRYGAYTSNPTSSPRYALRIITNGGSASDAFKDARVKFNDVNKFASDAQEYTLYFEAKTVNGPDFDLNLNIIKNYGTGGDPEEIINVNTFNITSTEQPFAHAFIFGSNLGKIIGTDDDDFIQIALSCPTDTSLGVEITNATLMLGNISVLEFPITTNKDFVDRSLVPDSPNPDGFDIGLPLILTKEGISFDNSQVGKIQASPLFYGEFGELLCDGATYRSDAYSTDGIPYRRLRNKLVDISPVNIDHNIPIFGTGVDYVTATNLSDNQLFISTNKLGTQTSTADGAVPTGFVITTVVDGQSSVDVFLDSWNTGADGADYWALSTVNGLPPSGPFTDTVTQIITFNPDSATGELIGTDASRQLIKITSTGVPGAGEHITIFNPVGADSISPWFTLDGVGVAPVASGTLVQINMLSTMDAQGAAYSIAQGISGKEVSSVTVLAGNVIPADSYFTFFANGQEYYVWYSLNGLGTDPSLGGAIGIPVTYAVSDTDITVRLNTVSAINDLYFSTPDLRGWTIKGWDDGAGEDGNLDNRFTLQQTRYSDPGINLPGYIGSYQNQALLSHGHQPLRPSGILGGSFRVDMTSTALSTETPARESLGAIGASGTSQNDVKNVYFNYIIKY